MRPSVICVTVSDDPTWRWIENRLGHWGLNWEFARAAPQNALERMVRRPNLSCLRAGFQAAQAAWKARTKGGDALIVAHGPMLIFWVAVFCRLLGVTPHMLAHSFNFTDLPHGPRRKLLSRVLAEVPRFVVYSSFERDLYSEIFSIPRERFDVLLWPVRSPEPANPEVPYISGEYVCAIGGNARDYATLLECARLLPQRTFVLVVRPESLEGLDVPPNVRAHVNLPLGVTMNVLLHSQLMVLPLTSTEVPCGHVTLVAAMYLSRAIVSTASEGVRDYVRDGDNALLIPDRDPSAMAKAVETLMVDRSMRDRMGRAGRSFVEKCCTEDRCVQHFESWLGSFGLTPGTTSASMSG